MNFRHFRHFSQIVLESVGFLTRIIGYFHQKNLQFAVSGFIRDRHKRAGPMSDLLKPKGAWRTRRDHCDTTSTRVPGQHGHCALVGGCPGNGWWGMVRTVVVHRGTAPGHHRGTPPGKHSQTQSNTGKHSQTREFIENHEKHENSSKIMKFLVER